MKVSNTQYAKTLYEMIEGKSKDQVDAVILSFSKFLIRKKASSRIEKILESFSKKWNLKNEIIECDVLSTEKLAEENMKKIEKYIANKYSVKNVKIKNLIDKSIKGGILIKMGDEIIDMSIDGNLKRLKKHLIS